jgi:CDP-diacylglycerol--glycerol-3-phosphate 3-phosphatidyltransferase
VNDTEPTPAKPSNVNLPNALTLLRIVIVPFFAVALAQQGGHTVRWRMAALLLFLLAIATDKIDGDLARRHNLVTDFGKVADPIADKALIGTALVMLSWLSDLPWWVTVIILGREIAVTALRFVVIRHGVMPASRGGKLKTVLQSVALPLFIAPLQALIVTVVTGVDYVVKAVALRRGSERTARKRQDRTDS